MADNPLVRLAELGQAVWLDYIRRDLIESGHLRRLIDEDRLRGLTSNPTIFEKAFAGGNLYDATIESLAAAGKSPREIYDIISREDVRRAADEFRSIYEESGGWHGLVSLEVDPHLAHDTAGTVNEARRLWRSLDRPNVFIKVPATRQGLPAIRQLIADGINVNVTLLFGLPRYREVADAYLAGLEARADAGESLDQVMSVASFFLSRIDTAVDAELEQIVSRGGEAGQTAESLQGRIAIASAKNAYAIHKEIFSGQRFQRLAARGARVQRLLWASTSTKNPSYRDTMYVDEIIAPDTINTIPLETLDAYRDHGDPIIRIEEDEMRAAWALEHLARLGIDLEKVTLYLENDGVEKFVHSFDKLIETLAARVPQQTGVL